ncbi:MAG TPA: hypothetical protein VFT55_09685, partial [Planctomycetota bacterium]|nr:hypothetical protein [Planctomycetota bacterium]
MQIPEHWAEARLVGKVKGQDRVVRRWGWSDTSAGDAQRQAEQRAATAMAELQAGRPVPTRERKRAYGGAGLPIREQVVARSGTDVITRNSYGARCLNVPDVLFADVDFVPRLPPAVERVFTVLSWAIGIAAFAMALVMFWNTRKGLGCSGLVASILGPILLLVLRVRYRNRPSNVEASRARQLAAVHAFVQRHPETRFAIYTTPAGLRVLALHATYEPAGAAARELFAAIGTDRAYAQMCELQACFRARVSAKPWRIGVENIVTRSVWPVAPERRADRDAWIGRYEQAAQRYAACRFAEEVGGGRVHPRCAAMQRVH